jgi:hypothetical protein
MKKQNCWEVMKCGKESNSEDDFFSEDGTCPASTELCTDGVNDGKNAGRACWAISETLCGDEVQGDHISKVRSCLKCEFYKHVQNEEGDKFVTGSELVEIVLYGEEIVQSKLKCEE